MSRTDITLNPPNPGQPADELALLVELDTRLSDTIDGLETLQRKADPGFRPVAADFRALHVRHRARVATLLQCLGHDPEQDGSVFGTVNKAAVALRSWLDTIDDGVMEAVLQGEKHVLQAYDAVIDASSDAERTRILRQDRAALVDMVSKHAPAAR